MKRESMVSIGPMTDGVDPAKTVEFAGNDVVCFCFGHTRRDVEQDCLANGRSMILAAIAAAKKAGGCDCTAKNPRGR